MADPSISDAKQDLVPAPGDLQTIHEIVTNQSSHSSASYEQNGHTKFNPPDSLQRRSSYPETSSKWMRGKPASSTPQRSQTFQTSPKGDGAHFRIPGSPRWSFRTKESRLNGGQEGGTFRRHSTIETNYSASFEQTQSWDQKMLLSLDGGGIRGYSTLLILQELMKKVGEFEKAVSPVEGDLSSGPAKDSFFPVTATQTFTYDETDQHDSHETVKPPTETSPWLPCHYFDYVAGTSTGGLIGILLGRLRMNVDDCIAEYEKLGEEVFGHSRWFHLRSPFWWPREQYNHKTLERIIQRVVNEKVPKIGNFPGGKNFQFDENRCRVLIVAYQEQDDDATEIPYLFRTYKNLHRTKDPKKKGVDRNPGPAHDIPIWQVARATSAAPRYFKEIEIEGRKYIDGGFGTNNPCEELCQEVNRMNNNNDSCIKCVISIGTGKSSKKRMQNASGFREKLKFGLGKFLTYANFAIKAATESETTHTRMLTRETNSKGKLNYYRFNVEEGLERMKLDEWKVDGPIRRKLGKWGKPSTSPAKEAEQETVGTEKGPEQSNESAAPPLTGTTNPTTTTLLPVATPPIADPHNHTLTRIRASTADYLSRPDVQTELSECARALVESRRSRIRADRERWDRACYGTWFQCQVEECPRGEWEYHDKHAMEKHLGNKHPTVFSKLGDDWETVAESEKLNRRRNEMERLLEEFKVIVH